MRHALAVAVVTVALSAMAGCADRGSSDGTAESAPSAAATSSAPRATGAGTDPVCVEVNRLIAENKDKVQQEVSKAATAGDADLEKARQTVEEIYADLASASRSAAGKTTDPELKSALETLASEATKVATSLDTQDARAALASIDASKVTAAAEQIQQICVGK